MGSGRWRRNALGVPSPIGGRWSNFESLTEQTMTGETDVPDEDHHEDGHGVAIPTLVKILILLAISAGAVALGLALRP